MPAPAPSNTLVYHSLYCLANELDTYLKTAFNLPPSDTIVVLSGHVSVDGSPITSIINKVSVTLVNLTPEATLRNLQPNLSGGAPRLNPALRLNLEVLFAANFVAYEESLKFISSTLTFFQGHAVFNAQNSPTLPLGINQLVVELEATSYQQWSYLWGMLGTKAMPGVIYKVRMLAIQSGVVQASSPEVTGASVSH